MGGFRPCHLQQLVAAIADKGPQFGRAFPQPGTGNLQPRSRGFTLIEILVVVVILGILAAIVVPRIMDRPDEAKRVAAKADIATLVNQLKIYRLDNGNYPTTEQGLMALVQRPGTNPIPPNWKPYLDRLPKDPWQGDYQYLYPGVKGEIDVFSLGADHARGGEGNAADIGNWE
jgi:general secretion pathway protein G